MDDPNDYPEPEPIDPSKPIKKYHYECTKCDFKDSFYLEGTRDMIAYQHDRHHQRMAENYGVGTNAYDTLTLNAYDRTFLKGCLIDPDR